MIESPTRFCTNRAIKDLISKYCPKNNVTILDVGCGSGNYYQYFTLSGINGRYLGIDIKTSENWQTKEEDGMHISFLVYDSEKLQYLNQKFDFIVAIQSLEHIKNDEEAMKGMRMCLKDEGYVLLTVPSEYSYLLYRPHGYRRYSLTRIHSFLTNEDELSIVEIVKLGGIATSLLHFVTWTTVPVCRIKIWELLKKGNLIVRMEEFAFALDKHLKFMEGGYAIVLNKKSKI